MQQVINKRMNLLRNRFETFRKEWTRPFHQHICELVHMYTFIMAWIYFQDNTRTQKQLDLWKSRIDMASVKAHEIYLGLLEHGIDVKYDKKLEENRIEDCGYGPKYLDFHKHLHAVEDLLNFCVIGTADRRALKKMEEDNAST